MRRQSLAAESLRAKYCLSRATLSPLNSMMLTVQDVICQDEFGDPKIVAANDSSDSKPFLPG
jgi:hypothetical protein